MLEEYKKIYEEKASLIDGWQDLSKNDLCNKYIEFEQNPTIADAYLSAIIYKYWPSISKMYFMSTPLASQEDCYDWVVNAIMYALKHRRWLDRDSTIFGDPRGPDKVINRTIQSERLTYFQLLNMDKRKCVLSSMSLDELQESGTDEKILAKNFEDLTSVDFTIKKYYNKKEYFIAFLLDCICNEECFDTSKSGQRTFNIKKLSRILRSIDNVYCSIFANRYGYDLEDVTHASTYVVSIPSGKMVEKIQKTLQELRFSSEFRR